MFAQGRWFDSTGSAVLETGGVLEEGPPLAIIQAGDGKTDPDSLKTPESFVWLNAWQIGGQNFFLAFGRMEDSYSLSLSEIVPGKGLLETALAWSASC